MNLTCIIFSTATFFDDKICRIPTGSRKDSLECRLYIEQNYRECRPYWKRTFWATEIGFKGFQTLNIVSVPKYGHFQNCGPFQNYINVFLKIVCVSAGTLSKLVHLSGSKFVVGSFFFKSIHSSDINLQVFRSVL